MAKVIVLVAVLLSFIATSAGAEDLVRDASALEQIEIQGVSLSMTAEQAFNKLRSAGFRAGDLNAYVGWDTEGIEFVRGEYGSPEGYSSVSMTRKGDRLVNISETWNAPGNPLDADAEIGAIKNQLSLPADADRCRANSAANGICEVRDAEGSEDANIFFKLQILSTMRLVTITRTKELKQ